MWHVCQPAKVNTYSKRLAADECIYNDLADTALRDWGCVKTCKNGYPIEMGASILKRTSILLKAALSP
ncbi:hypothetical protein RRG08_067135 [Elysia crispata]|uniref:Uncharacterized protein n=1 Tax=Elysia crispata TaxID=231223 RepID=A0AAE0ZHQ3_9GAST|nr:hypothetical protein RRG08_067135 [Elysia crispata]